MFAGRYYPGSYFPFRYFARQTTQVDQTVSMSGIAVVVGVGSSSVSMGGGGSASWYPSFEVYEEPAWGQTVSVVSALCRVRVGRPLVTVGAPPLVVGVQSAVAGVTFGVPRIGLDDSLERGLAELIAWGVL